MIVQVQDIRNRKGGLVGKLYFLEDGNLHPDSWVCDKRYFKDN